MAFSTPAIDAQFGFIRAMRQLIIYSRTTQTGVQSFVLREISGGAFITHYCKIWINGNDLMLDHGPTDPIGAGYTADPPIAFNSLEYGYIGNDSTKIIVGTGDVRYKTANPHGSKPTIKLYDIPTSESTALVISCKKDYEITFYRKGTNLTTNDIPDNLIYNP